MDNGGGSMDEAMKLAGMFIDSVLSPLYWITKKGANHYKRPYPGMIYDPIVILINKRLQQVSFSLLHCKTTIEHC
jgi:carboxyl-terminal processing protease